jgi:hypothetical protein
VDQEQQQRESRDREMQRSLPRETPIESDNAKGLLCWNIWLLSLHGGAIVVPFPIIRPFPPPTVLFFGPHSYVPILSARANVASVLLRTSSTVTPRANSVNVNPPRLRSTSNTQRSVMILLATLTPVSGSVHFWRILLRPFLSVWSVTTMTCDEVRRG